MPTLRWLDDPTAGMLSAVNRLLGDFGREVIPDEPDKPVDELLAEITGAPSHRRTHVLEALEDGEVAGAAILVAEDLQGRDTIAWLKTLVVAPSYRRRHVGSSMAAAVLERSREESRQRFQTFVPPTPAAAGFATGLGATRTGIVSHQNRLRTSDLDREMLERWIARAPERAGGYSLLCFDGRCPGEWLGGFTELVAVMNTAPRSDADEDVVYSTEQVVEQEEAHLASGGWGWTVCARHDSSGELVAFTELGGSRYRPWLAQQGETGVHPDHRNRGLGRWIKAVNASRLLVERPEVSVVETWNADTNAPMLSINEAMGFRRVAEWVEWTRPLVR